MFFFGSLSEAPVSGRVLPGVRDDHRTVRPLGSVEEKRPEEKSPLVLITTTSIDTADPTTLVTPPSELRAERNEECLLNRSTYMQRREKE